ncbi:MAG: C40 family peptidase [Thermoleophilia bacterium]
MPGGSLSRRIALGLGVFLALLSFGLLASLPALALPAGTTTSVVLTGEAKERVDDLRSRAEAVQAEIDALDVELERASESYNETNVRLDTINQELAALRRRLRDTQAQYDYRRNQIGRRLAETYKAGNTNFLEILLATQDFTSFVKRLILILTVTSQDRHLVDDFKTSLGNLNYLEVQVERKKEEGLALRRELEAKQRDIDRRLAERQATLDGLDSRIAALIEEERQRQEAERLRLEAELRTKLARWQRYDGPLPQTDDAVLNQLVETAAAYLGIPYLWGGDRPSTGMDCSGFLQYVYRQHGIELPHFSGYQAQMGVPVTLAEIRPGDLIAFGSPVHHVGMYIGEGKFIHAPRTGDVIRISLLAARNDISTIRRFPVQPRSGPPRFD